MPEPLNTHMFDLIILMGMSFVFVTSVAVFSLLGKWANGYRDDVLLGVKNGVPLSLKHRRDIFTGDWVVLCTIIVGGVAFVGFVLLKLARLSEDEGVALIGYCGAAAHFWGVLMTVIFYPLEAFALVKQLRGR